MLVYSTVQYVCIKDDIIRWNYVTTEKQNQNKMAIKMTELV